MSAPTVGGVPIGDYDESELDIARGKITGYKSVNKFGRSTNVDNNVTTDIWDRANATHDQVIWIAPEQARIHAIVSSSLIDTLLGAGARTIEIFGLINWDEKEVSEVVEMDGQTPVNTDNAYVIIHRMKVVTKGATSVNDGLITATAATDGTVTAQINADTGQTHMAIYGIPSIQTGYMSRLYGNVNRASGATALVDVSLLVNPEPDVELLNFLSRHTFGLMSAGTSALTIMYATPKVFPGPAIIKVEGTGGADNLDVSAGFDLVLIDN